MFNNYFKVSWRHLRRNKSYTFINVLGLTLGMTCGILIFTLVAQQLSFDTFHPQADRIFRIVTDLHHETTTYTAGVPTPLGNALRNDYTFADKIARVKTAGDALISIPSSRDNLKFQEKEGVAYAEPDFFDIFHFPLLQGNSRNCITAPNTAVITEKLAKKYFPGQNPIGQTIRLGNKTDFQITGILRDLPANTDRRQEIYLSWQNLRDEFDWLADESNWRSINNGMQCFLRAKPGVTAQSIEAALPGLKTKYYAATRAANVYQFRAQPLSDIHFNPNYEGYVQKRYLWALALVGIFLIGTACVNFINLATAQALTRSREVGVRKVLGGMRHQLFWQFIAETGLIALFATLISYALAKQTIPWLNQLLEMNLELPLFPGWSLLLFLTGLLIFVVFLSGSYPGLVISGFQPVLALKGKLTQRNIGSFSLRRSLVTTQFAISQLLIISTLVIAGQIHYSSKTDMGFQKDAVVLVPIPTSGYQAPVGKEQSASNGKEQMDQLKTSLTRIAGVEKVSLCFTAPASPDDNLNDITFDNRGQTEQFNVNVKNGDDQYLSTFGMSLVAGRNFFPSDSTREFLVNETLVKMLNVPSPADIIGKKLQVDRGQLQGTIVGVVKDFHNGSFRGAIAPICISPNYNAYSLCAVKINMARASLTLGNIEKLWNNLYPKYIYSYQFFDDSIAEFYQRDTVLLTLIEIFAGITIFIGCLGLYGMVSFMAVQKTKEIGVRKVLGAGIPDILWIFGREFATLLLLAFIVAAPIAWFAMNAWLKDFVYRIALGAPIFGAALLATFLIAAVTVGYRTLRSALANPSISLRSE